VGRSEALQGGFGEKGKMLPHLYHNFQSLSCPTSAIALCFLSAEQHLIAIVIAKTGSRSLAKSSIPTQSSTPLTDDNAQRSHHDVLLRVWRRGSGSMETA